MSNAQKVSELLPCPFCGGEGTHQTDTEEDTFSEEWIGCTDCGATAAIEVWKRRAAPAPDAHSEVGVKALAGYFQKPFMDRSRGWQEVPDEWADREDVIPLYVVTAGVVKAEPVTITYEMVERAKAALAETGRGTHRSERIIRMIFTAALASKPEGER